MQFSTTFSRAPGKPETSQKKITRITNDFTSFHMGKKPEETGRNSPAETEKKDWKSIAEKGLDTF